MKIMHYFASDETLKTQFETKEVMIWILEYPMRTFTVTSVAALN